MVFKFTERIPNSVLEILGHRCAHVNNLCSSLQVSESIQIVIDAIKADQWVESKVCLINYHYLTSLNFRRIFHRCKLEVLTNAILPYFHHIVLQLGHKNFRWGYELDRLKLTFFNQVKRLHQHDHSLALSSVDLANHRSHVEASACSDVNLIDVLFEQTCVDTTLDNKFIYKWFNTSKYLLMCSWCFCQLCLYMNLNLNSIDIFAKLVAIVK